MREFGRKKVVIEVNYREVQDLAKEIYGVTDYHFGAVQECGNDTTHKFNVDGKLGEWDRKQVDLIKAGDVRDNSVLLNLLCSEGHIEAGQYNVRVSW